MVYNLNVAVKLLNRKVELKVKLKVTKAGEKVLQRLKNRTKSVVSVAETKVLVMREPLLRSLKSSLV